MVSTEMSVSPAIIKRSGNASKRTSCKFIELQIKAREILYQLSKRVDMASPSNFFSGLEIHFITKRLVRVEHKILVEKINSFGGTVKRSSERKTPWSELLNCFWTLWNLCMSCWDPVSLVGIEWLPVCIAQGKLIPTAQFEVSIIYNIWSKILHYLLP